MLSYWGLFLVFDVISVASELFLQGILCHTNILYVTLTAFDQIDYTLCLASGRYGHCVGFSSFAFESVCFLDVITGLTSFYFTSLVSCIFCEGDSRLSY